MGKYAFVKNIYHNVINKIKTSLYSNSDLLSNFFFWEIPKKKKRNVENEEEDFIPKSQNMVLVMHEI
jgi:hypothetical protein